MLAFMIIIAVVLVAPSEEMREFSRHSNGVRHTNSSPAHRASGLRRSGYASCPRQAKVYLKQNQKPL